MGQPVCFETAAFEATRAIRFGFCGLSTSIVLLINRDDAVTLFDGLPWRSVSPHLPTTSSSPRDIGQFVVLHLLNVPDKRLHERKELFEAVIPTESLQMILGRGPFDAQHESLRFLSAVGQFVS